MSAKHVQLLGRLVFPLALLGCLLLSACAGSSPVQSAPVRSPAKSPPFVAKLQPLLLAQMQQLRIPGAIVYVNDPGQGSWSTALGMGNLATREPMQVTNYMRVGSIAKTFTATIILQLVDQHKLRLDDPVSKYQPQVPNGAHITIRELLNMSNTNYILLGLIMQQLTHLPAAQAWQHYIFGPLGMHQTSLPPPTSSAIPDPHTQGYMYGLDFTGTGPLLNVTDWNPSWGWTAGGAISTLHDLQIWAKALATGQLLSAATQQQRLSSWNNTGLFWLGKPFRYGLGVIDFAGFLGHSGDLFGFNSWMAYQPQTGATIIVLSNLIAAAGPTPPAEKLAGVIQQELFA